MVTVERVAFAGDWHMNAAWAGRAIRYAHDLGAQHIVHLGDFGFTFQQRFLDEVDSTLRACGLRLWFVDGNHESFPWLDRVALAADGSRPLSSRIVHLPRGFRWTWGGVRFLAMGGAYSVDRAGRLPGRSWWPEETITRRQQMRAGSAGKTDVLVAHDCPAKVVIPGIDDVDIPSWIAADDLRRSFEHRLLLDGLCAMTEPTAVWHGHYHRRHRTVAHLGYGPVVVNGLDCDESTLEDNVAVLDVAELLVRDVALAEEVQDRG